jgi:hypothetical protein
MNIENVLIEKKASYDTDYPSQLVGLVQIKGDHGKMEVKLSSAIVSQIFGLIKKDVQRVADYNASQASHAVSEAEASVLLIEGSLPAEPSL